MTIRRLLTFTKISALSFMTTLGVTATLNAQESISSNIDAKKIDSQIREFYGLNAMAISTDAEAKSKLDKLRKAAGNNPVLVNPKHDTDKDGLDDFLEVYGFYDDIGQARAINYTMSIEDLERFRSRPDVWGEPVYRWAVDALEDSGFIVPLDDNVNVSVDLNNAYDVLYNKFIAMGLPLTHSSIIDSASKNGTIASIIAQLATQYEPLIPVINGQPVQVYYTNYKLFSSDLDQYSDKEEALKIFSGGGPRAPADDPLIGAIPKITASLKSFTLTDIQEYRETNGVSEKHTDVERQVTTKSKTKGFSLGAQAGFKGEDGEGNVNGKINFSETNAIATSTEDRDSFGTISRSTEVTSLNCFAKLGLSVYMVNSGSDLASDIQTKLQVTMGDKVWQTIDGSEYTGGGVTLGVDQSSDDTALGLNGEKSCLTIDQANYLYNGGIIGITSELKSATMRYFDDNSKRVETGGNWSVAQVSFNENLARIEFDVITTKNVKIKRTFWVTAYDKDNSQPNIHYSIKQVLEKAYTPIDCDENGYSDKILCLRTEFDGDILLGKDTAFDFLFYDLQGNPLNYYDSAKVYKDILGTDISFSDSVDDYDEIAFVINSKNIDINLPKRSSVSIYDISSTAPTFDRTEVTYRNIENNNEPQLEVRATVSDSFGISTVEFCKNTEDCYPMLPSLPEQSSTPYNGYYKLALDGVTLQDSDFIRAKNVVGNSNVQKPKLFYMKLDDTLINRLEGYEKFLDDIDKWLNTLSILQIDDPQKYQDIKENGLIDSEASVTHNKNILDNEFVVLKSHCSYGQPLAFSNSVSLLAQQQSCETAIHDYEQALTEHHIKMYDPNKLPISNQLIPIDHGYANQNSSKDLVCELSERDVITGMQLNYKKLGRQHLGIKLSYRTMEPTYEAQKPYKWSGVKHTSCGTTYHMDEDSWDFENYINGTTIRALVDFGWTVRNGRVNRLCAVYRDFDLVTLEYSKAYDTCNGTHNWGGLDRFSNTAEFRPSATRGIEVADKKSLTGVVLNAKFTKAEVTQGQHHSYKYGYQPSLAPEHLLVDKGKYRIRSNLGLFLAVKGEQSASRTLAMEVFNEINDQVWIVERVNDREYRLRPDLESFNGYLSRHEGSDDASNNLFVAKEEGDELVNYNQHWRIEYMEQQSAYHIKSVVNFKALEGLSSLQLTGDDLLNGNLKWDFIPVSGNSVKPVKSSLGQSTSYTNGFKNFSTGTSFDSTPIVLMNMQTFTGTDPSSVRITDVVQSDFRAMVEEEASHDNELYHAEETLGFIAMEEGQLLDIDGNVIGESGSIDLDNDWHTLYFSQQYDSPPVVIMMMNSYNDHDPAHVRLSSVLNSSVQAKIEEWAYKDGIHYSEKVGYLVIKEGTHTLADGKIFDVKKVDSNHEWKNVEFNSAFTQKPIVFSQSQTYRGSDPIVSRHKDITIGSVKLRLQEEEANDDSHATETVGVIAIN